jgi:hypothetical protein
MRNRRHDRFNSDHYFSPRTPMPERFWIPIQTFAADGGTRPNFRGRSVSSALLCISFRIRAGGAAETFQRGSLRTTTQIRKHVFQKAPSASAPNRAHTTQQAWMNSRNPPNIATAFTHRQLVILHHSLTAGHWRALRGRIVSSTLQVFQIILSVAHVTGSCERGPRR